MPPGDRDLTRGRVSCGYDGGAGRLSGDAHATTPLWMMEKASTFGLAFDKRRLAGIRALPSRDRLHNSYRGIYLPFRTRNRRIGVTNRDGSLHASVLGRYQRRPR